MSNEAKLPDMHDEEHKNASPEGTGNGANDQSSKNGISFGAIARDAIGIGASVIFGGIFFSTGHPVLG